MPNFFDSPTNIITNITRWADRRRRVLEAADRITPEQAANMSQFASMFPFLPPGLVRSLGQSGIRPDDPVAQFAVKTQMAKNIGEYGNYSGAIGLPERRSQSSANSRLSDLRRARSFEGREDKPINPTAVQSLLKTAETMGVFDPNSQVLIEPEFGTENDPYTQSRPHQIFTTLQDRIHDLSGAPVPYVGRDGQLHMFTPETSGFGDPIANLTDSPLRNAGPTVLGAGGTAGPQIMDPMAEQREASKGAIAQIFAGAEDTVNTAHTRQAMLDQLAKRTPVAQGMGDSTGVSGLVRPVMMGLEAPIQEAKGLVRNVYGELHGEDVNWLESQSDLGVTVGRLLNGKPVEVGTGFFVDPDSAVAKERRLRESERGDINGRGITLGRILTNSVGIEPDSKPYNIVSGLVDGTFEIAGDPTIWALGGTSKIQKSRKFFSAAEEAGATRGIRKYFDGPTFDQWANKNTKLIDKLTSIRDPYEIARLTHFQLDPALTANLAGASKSQDIRGILDGAIERGRLLTTTQVEGTRTQRRLYNWEQAKRAISPRHNPRTTRITKMSPNQTLDLEDHADVATQLVRHMQNAHAREDDVKAVYNAVATAKSRNGLRNAVIDAQDRVGGLLDQYGIKDPEIRSFLTRTNRSTYNEDLRGWSEVIGSDTPPWERMAVDGEMLDVGGPHLPLEHIGRYMHLPDQAVIRRLTSKYKFLTAAQTDIPLLTPLRIKAGKEVIRDPNVVGKPRMPVAAADFIMSEFLKPAWLLRIAWPVRVVGEEQLRMAADGLHSMTNHPLSYIAMVTGSKETRLARFLDTVSPGIKNKLDISPGGRLFDEAEELSKVTYRAHGPWIDQPGTIAPRVHTVYTKNSVHELADYRRSWSHELALLHNDPVSNYVANHGLEDSIQWFFRGSGNKFRRELMEAHPGQLATEAQVRNYIQHTTDRISYVTSNHPDLIDIVKTGRYSTYKDGEELASSVWVDRPRVNPAFTDYLKTYTDVGPDKIWGNVAAQTNLPKGADWIARYNHGLDRFMSLLMGTPTSTLSRSPAFRQYVWRRTTQLIQHADDSARKTILANAKATGLSSREMRSLTRAAVRGKTDDSGKFIGKLNADEIDLLAKGYAIDDTKALLYDLSERSQIFDVMRTIIPFGEAWKEVLTRWAKLATISGPGGIPLPGPAVAKFQHIITGARESGAGELFGAPEGQGLFHQNEFGEEVFVYPGSQWATQALSGVPVPLTGRVQGLNMFGEILPGLGPVAQIPIAWFLQDKPEYDWWREQLVPFGGPGATGTKSIFELRNYLPAWAKTALDIVTEGGWDDRMWNSSIMYTANYLHSTGEYGDSVEEQSRLLEDAKNAAKDIYKVRALGQFILPSSPTFNWLTQDEEGNLLNTRILAEEFYRLQQEDYDSAVDKFLDMYGTDAIGAIVPHSRNIITSVPVSLEGAKWASNHKSVKKNYPFTYGMFAPQGEFHMQTYARNFLTGERDPITPAQWRNLMDTLLGNYHYTKAQGMLGEDKDSPNTDQRNWLRGVKKEILEAYPNWNNNVGLGERPTLDQQVDELYRATRSRVLMSTDAGKGLKAYLGLRDQAQAQAQSQGIVSFRSANKMAPTRQWLADGAFQIMQRYPDFERMWTFVFEREMEDDVNMPALPSQTSGTAP